MMIELVHKTSRKRNYVLFLALTIAVLAVCAGGSMVSADVCSASLSQPILSGAAYSSGESLLVPVSATCPSVGGPLYAIGDAYDTTTNTDLGSVNTALTPVNGLSVFNGQLAFSPPPVSQSDNVQITVSIYSGVFGTQSGPALTTATENLQTNANSPPVGVQNDPSQYCNSDPNCNYQYNSYGGSNYQGSYGTHHSHHHNSQYQQEQIVTVTQQVPFFIPPDNTWLIDMVITAVIAIAVVGAIGFAILAARSRQPPQRPY